MKPGRTAACGLTLLVMLFGLGTPRVVNADTVSFSEMGLARIPISASKTMRTLELRVRAIPRCRFGDADALILDLAGRKAPTDILLTLEPAVSRKNLLSPVVKNLSRVNDADANGVALSLEFPRDIDRALLGLFLCTDADGDGRCGQKPAANVNQTLLRKRSQAISAGANPPADKIYFFQFLLFESEWVYYRARGFTAEDYPRVSDFFEQRGIGRAYARENLERIRYFSEKLGSLPLRARGRVLEIRLPGYSRTKCEPPTRESVRPPPSNKGPSTAAGRRR